MREADIFSLARMLSHAATGQRQVAGAAHIYIYIYTYRERER